MVQGVVTAANPFPPGAGATQLRLVAAAHEFEAQMMKELLGPLEQDGQGLEGSDGENGSNGVLGEFATEALAQSLSQHGGLGIAHRILHELLPRGAGERPDLVGRKPETSMASLNR